MEQKPNMDTQLVTNESSGKLSQEFAISEFLRCKENFKYFCSKYIKIEMPGGDVPLNLYAKQEELINQLQALHYLLILKSRQIGISTIIQAYVCWLHTFFQNVGVGILSKDGSEATSFARKIMNMLDKLPKWMAPKYTKQTEQTYILDNGGECYATTINPNAPEKTLRGKALTFLIVDEGAFIRHMDLAWTGMMPTMATTQLHARKNSIPYGTIVISTPNKTVGVGKWFYTRYLSSVSGTDIFKPFTIHWRQIPELANDPSWYDTQCQLAGNDQKKIQQELELKFISSAGSFFDEKTIELLQSKDIKPIETMRLFGGEVWTFAKPIEGRYYIIGVDTAPEHGMDKSAITIWDYETLDQVWEYQVKCKIIDFIKIVKVACSFYPGLAVIEVTGGYGNQVVESMMASEYSQMIYKYKPRTDSSRPIPGLSTNGHTRPLMVDALYSYVNENPGIVKSKRLALELIGLIDKGGRIEGDTGCNDDLCLSAACAFYVRKWDPPLMLPGSSRVGVNEDFSDIMSMNDSTPRVPTTSSVTAEMKNIIDEMSRDRNGVYVNTLSLYNRKKDR